MHARGVFYTGIQTLNSLQNETYCSPFQHQMPTKIGHPIKNVLLQNLKYFMFLSTATSQPFCQHFPDYAMTISKNPQRFGTTGKLLILKEKTCRHN